MRNGMKTFVWAFALCALATTAGASVVYEFIDTSGASLAEIELASVPAGFSDLLSYRLTAAGDALFHLGTMPFTFAGFSSFWGDRLLDDGAGGLKGSAPYFDPGEVLSTLFGGPGGFYTGFYGSDSDFMRSSPNVGAQVALGHYLIKPIPEPATGILFALGLAGFGLCAYRARRPIR